MWLQKILAGAASLTFGADGRVLYVLDTRGEITAWDVAGRTKRRIYWVGDAAAGEIRLPDTKLWTACDDRFLVVRLRSAVYVWNAATGAERARLPLEPNGYPPDLDPTRRLLVMPDSQRELLATWDIAERKPAPPLLRAEPAAPDRFGIFGVTADGNTVAVGTARREIVLYDRPTNRVLARFDTIPGVGLALQLVFSPDGKTLAILGLNRITLWDVPSQTVRENFIRCPMPIHLWAVHPTLPVLATRNSDFHITLFRLDTAEPLRSFDFSIGTSALKCVCFSPDGLTCAVGGSNKQFAVFDVDL